MALCEKANGEVVNIGSGEEWSIEETIQIISDITQSNIEIVSQAERVRPERSEVNRLLADNKKIISLTGWKPEFTFREGLELTINWISENLDYFNINVYEK